MLEKFTTAFMIGDRQLEMAKRMKKGDLAIILSVNGNYAFSYKTLQYLKKSGCTIVLITCMEEDILHFIPDYKISIGTPKDGKSGKHSLLALMELMSLRYYALYYPSLDFSAE
jgi:DNA-binding MurR/RpiR family transcriptional regulator